MKKTLILLSTISIIAAFSGDDKFLKKYAMMKVYESCFGQDVVKEVRMEMKAAASKCAGISPSAPSVPLPLKIHSAATHHTQPHRIHSQVHTISSGSGSDIPHQMAQESVSHGSAVRVTEPPHKTPASTIDLSKLQEAIMAGYNKHAAVQQQSFPGQQPYVPPGGFRPYPAYQGTGPLHNSLYYPGYQPQPQYLAPQYNPYHAPAPLYPASPFPSYYTGRSSRDLDIRGQLETLTNQMSGKVRNVTCVMQELGYLDTNLDPDYNRMVERIGRLPVAEDLKKDMTEGVEFCRQFSQCVPDDRKDKLIREMVRPMFFFRCYKHKKLEACIMKDVRERYNNAEELTEDTLNDNRSGKEFPEDNMATAIYEFLYGGDNIDIDTLV